MNPSLPRLGCTVVDWLLLYAKVLETPGCLASVTLSWEDKVPGPSMFLTGWKKPRQRVNKLQLQQKTPDMPTLSTGSHPSCYTMDETQVSHKDNELGPALWTQFLGVGRVLPSPL